MKSMGGAGGMAGMAAGLNPDATADAAVLAKTMRNAFSAVKSATLGLAQMVQASYIALLVLLLLFIIHQVITHHFEHAKHTHTQVQYSNFSCRY